MTDKKPNAGARAWRILRLAFLWARKGSALRRWRLIVDLRVALRGLRGGARGRRVRCMERELSFDETPTFSFKVRRPASLRFPRIPCIASPSVHLDDDEDDWIFYGGEKECRFFDHSRGTGECCSNDDDEEEECDGDEEEESEEEGIDSKAEEFISKFYEQMKLQRQVSLVRYEEMLQRGVS